jgi:formylglycine-generating enzyme required for sulfatase activity
MPLSKGQILNNRYRITRLLGQGGFGAVYQAWDLNLEKHSAIKENLDVSEEARRQFKREARILSDLTHPNLPRVIDHFSVPGAGQYLVMDYVDGWDLASVLEKTKRPIPLERALPWIAQVCEALEYLHSRTPPIVHRDLKPANIKITPKAQAMLVDFGIAKTLDSVAATTVGARAVTPGYSPIEQYGQGAHTDARSDIYSLGATLYTMLTAKEPTGAPERNLGTLLPEPHLFNPAISARLEALILKAMSLRPENRFQSVAEFRAALTPVLAGLSLPDPAFVASIPVASPVAPAPKPAAVPPTVVIPQAQLAPTAVVGGSALPATSQAGPQQKRKKASGVVLLWLLGLSIACFFIAVGSAIWLLSTLEYVEPTAEPVFVVRSTFTPQAAATPTPAAPLLEYPQVLIPAGEFTMGIDPQVALAECQALNTTACDLSWFEAEGPAHKVYLDSFLIDVYEVTNARYAACVEAGECPYPGMGNSQTRSNYYSRPEYADYPLVYTTWEMAQAYCEWRGGRLPSEAEWEKAAQGGLEGTLYPWGNERPDCGRVNFNDGKSCIGDTSKVGSYASNPYGLYDIAGNVWEWVQDYYLADYYLISPYENPPGPETGSAHVVRGGSWNNEEIYMRTSVRYFALPTKTLSLLGFRCAANP